MWSSCLNIAVSVKVQLWHERDTSIMAPTTSSSARVHGKRVPNDAAEGCATGFRFVLQRRMDETKPQHSFRSVFFLLRHTEVKTSLVTQE